MFWGSDWSCGLPLLIVTVVFHVWMFVLIERALAVIVRERGGGGGLPRFTAAIAVTALAAAMLHGVEAAAWALLYLWLGAIGDPTDAMLYSLSAITSYGHAEIFLENHWRLLGAIEAMNGLILFGLTTAFLFAAIEDMRPPRRR